jgi:nitroreductase
MDTPWHSILEQARHAPSPHNAQPWRVHVLDEARAEVYVEGARTLPEEELTGSLLVLTMGSFVEAMRLAAAQQGYDLDDELAAANDSWAAKELDQRGDDFVLFARSSLRPSSKPAPYASELFLARRTSRLPFDADPVGLLEARALNELASTWGYRYTQSSDPKRIARRLEANQLALERRFSQPACRAEVTRWMRFSDRDARRRGDGLDARCMNRQPFAFFADHHWRGTIRPWGHNEGAPRTATMGCLAGPFGACKEWHRAGRFFMHFWLECTRLGLVMQPLAPLVYDAEAAKRGALDWRVPGIWMEFRIGRSSEPAKSYRRAVDDLLLEADEIRCAEPPTSPATADRRS